MGREDRKIIGLVFAALLFITACVKDKPAAPVIPTVTDTSGSIYIVCEGNLGNGNASLALYQPATGAARDIFETVNGQPLGDVFQSMKRIGDKLFLCINNSDKIIVVNASDWKLAGSISIPKPRYILPVSDNKAYVSTLFSNKVYAIDPRSLQVTGTITMPAQNTEGMLLHQGSVYFCAWDTASNKVFKLNPATDAIQQEITVAGYAPQEILADKFDMLWVLSGNVPRHKRAALTRIDPASGQAIASYLFPENADPIRPVMNNARDMLYFIGVNYKGGTDYNGIFRMGIRDTALPQQPFIAAGQFQYFWALGIEPATDKMYIGDPKGFIQKGSVSVYRADGVKEKEFSTGIGPGHFYFGR